MATHTIRKGLNLPIEGSISSSDYTTEKDPEFVALLPQESWGIKPQMLVKIDEEVKIGTPLFRDKRDPKVIFTAPAAGIIHAINRGERRAVQSVVIKVKNFEDSIKLDNDYKCRESLKEILATSGLWPNLRQRPFDTVANSNDLPNAIFVTATNTHPLAADPYHLVKDRNSDIKAGLKAMCELSNGKVYFSMSSKKQWENYLIPEVEDHTFNGPHPAGNVGVHINALHPVNMERRVWHIDVQNLADIGLFLTSGALPTERIVAIVGPAAIEQKLIQTRHGASIEAFKDYAEPNSRFISGSVLSGATANPGEPLGYLSRYSQQISIVNDSLEREFMGWMKPVGSRWSFSGAYLAKFFKKSFKVDTDTNGSERAIVPSGAYEKVMPCDIMATQLIKALVSDDIDNSEKLGALELVEEDMALCEYVCPSKINITESLRTMLTRIEKES